MDQSIVALYDGYEQAEQAVQSLQENGYDNKFSVFMKNRDTRSTSFHNDNNADNTNDIYSEVGAIAGFTLGVMAYAIPGLSPIMAGGPLAGQADGSARGSFLDALGEEGYGDNQKQYLVDQLEQGKIMVAVHGEYGDLPAAHQILTSNGGMIVDTGSMNADQLDEAYDLQEIPVEPPAEEVIPIPAHLIDDDSYIDPNIGYGDYDLVDHDEGIKKPD